MKCLIDKGYVPRLVAEDWDYGTKEDKEYLENFSFVQLEQLVGVSGLATFPTKRFTLVQIQHELPVL